MNQPRDPDVIIATWLDDGPIDLPEETRRAFVVGLRTQPRARRMAILGGLPVNQLSRFAAAAAIVFAVGALSVFVLSNRNGGIAGVLPPSVAPSTLPTVSASPSASGTSSSTPSVSTAGWVPFSSARYGYDITYPTDWTAQQSTRQWSLATDQKDWLTTAADNFRGTNVRFTAFAVDLPAGTSSDTWIASYFGPDGKASPDPCGHTAIDLGTKQVDGHPVAFWVEDDTATCGGTTGFVVVNGRLHVFTIWLSRQEPMLEALLSTVKFKP
jgi:hypothetical protein